MTSTLPPVYQNNMRCGQGLGTTDDQSKYSLTGEIKKINGKTPAPLPLIIVFHFGLGDNTEFDWAPNTSSLFEHYLIRNKDGLMEVFKNGQLMVNGGANFYFDLNSFEAIINLVGNNISNIVTLDRAQIDELIVYDKALTWEEIKILYDSYNWNVSGPSSVPGAMSQTDLKEDIIVKVSPNPTTGTVSLEGNVDLEK